MKKAAIADRFVIRSGFEPETHSLEGYCSIQLSYQTKPMQPILAAELKNSGAKLQISWQNTK